MTQIFFKINNNANQNTRYRSHHRKLPGIHTSSQGKGSSADPIELESLEGPTSSVRSGDGVPSPLASERLSRTVPAPIDSHIGIRSNVNPSARPILGEHTSPVTRDQYAVPSSPETRLAEVSVALCRASMVLQWANSKLEYAEENRRFEEAAS